MAAVTTQTPSDAQNRITGIENLVLKDYAEIGTISTGVKARWLVDKPYVLRALVAKIGTCGTSGNNTIVVNKNGVAVTGLTITIANDDADGTQKTDAPTSETKLVAGDVIDVEVTAAAGGASGADLTGHVVLVEDLT